MLKVGWLCPCIGIGGGDAYMASIIQHSTQLEHIGIYVQDPITNDRYKWFKQLCHKEIKINQVEGQFVDHYKVKGVTYFPENSHEECFLDFANECDVIISWCFKNLEFFPRSLTIPIIEIIQNSDDYAREIALENKKYVDYRVGVSQHIKTIFKEQDTSSIPFVNKVIYNAVEPNRVTPRYGRNYCRKAFNLEDKKVILFMGRFVEEKVPQALIQALTELPEEWVALYVGQGYREEDLVAEAERYVPERVYLMEPQYYVGDILSMADVFMLCSDFEGHPLSVCEAWLAGVPTVVSNTPVMEELRDIYGALSTYVPLRATTKQLAEAVLRADSNSGDINEEVNRARYVSWNDFTTPKAAAIWEEYINDCIYDFHKKNMRSRVAKILNSKPLTTCKVSVTKLQMV